MVHRRRGRDRHRDAPYAGRSGAARATTANSSGCRQLPRRANGPTIAVPGRATSHARGFKSRFRHPRHLAVGPPHQGDSTPRLYDLEGDAASLNGIGSPDPCPSRPTSAASRFPAGSRPPIRLHTRSASRPATAAVAAAARSERPRSGALNSMAPSVCGLVIAVKFDATTTYRARPRRNGTADRCREPQLGSEPSPTISPPGVVAETLAALPHGPSCRASALVPLDRPGRARGLGLLRRGASVRLISSARDQEVRRATKDAPHF